MKYKAQIIVFSKDGLPDVAALRASAKLDEVDGRHAFQIKEVRTGRAYEIKFAACDHCHALSLILQMLAQLEIFDENTEIAEVINISLDQPA